MSSFNWECPFCYHKQTVVEEKYHEINSGINVGSNWWGNVYVVSRHISCSNQDCQRMTSWAGLYKAKRSPKGTLCPDRSKELARKDLLPDSSAKPQPEFIPEPIREDYTEACKIRNLSPKASATLARRCLQGMIRNFCGISKTTLHKEIEELRKLVSEDKAPKGVSEESVDAIDAIRSVGNIGAHMEQNINHIVPVESDEAQILIDLIESLFDEWYIARYRREQRFSLVKNLADEKKQLKHENPIPIEDQSN